jgi:thiamine phosphate synthase YjbQ (UPF0047 family)
MNHATEYLTFETPHRRDYVNITDQLEAFVEASGIQDGLCLVNPMHITAVVYVSDAESGLSRTSTTGSSASRRTSPPTSTGTTTGRTTPTRT